MNLTDNEKFYLLTMLHGKTVGLRMNLENKTISDAIRELKFIEKIEEKLK